MGLPQFTALFEVTMRDSTVKRTHTPPLRKIEREMSGQGRGMK